MVLDELHELIETLQARIDQHAAALQQSEALTRYALVDPLLRALNWDTGDPSQVIPEYRSAAGSADYALFGQSNKPQVIIEAKKLGTHLDFKVRQQVTGYCQEEGIPYAVITDGRRWELYDVFKPVAMKDSIVVEIDLEGPIAKTSLDVLALWHRSVAEGSIQTGAAPVLDASETPSGGLPSASPIAKSPTSPLEDGWQSLADFAPKVGEYPDSIRLPSGTEIAAKWWGPFIEAIVRHLSQQGDLTATHVPIRNKNGRYVVALKSDPPMGPQGQLVKNMRDVDDFLVNTNFQAAANASHARLIIQSVGLDPADFAVRLQ